MKIQLAEIKSSIVLKEYLINCIKIDLVQIEQRIIDMARFKVNLQQSPKINNADFLIKLNEISKIQKIDNENQIEKMLKEVSELIVLINSIRYKVKYLESEKIGKFDITKTTKIIEEIERLEAFSLDVLQTN